MNRVQRFSRNVAGRDLIVGDIHGHFTKLERELTAIEFNPATDRLFSVGDLVDRGPESDKALEWIAKPWFHAIQGNHEDMAISWAKGLLDSGLYVANGGGWNVGNPKHAQHDIAEAFKALPVAIELQTRGGLLGIVHADCPARSWQQFVVSLESPLTSPNELEHLIAMAQWNRQRCELLLTDDIQGIRALVVGHTPMERMTSLGNVLFIDTGGWLGRPFCIIDADTLRPADRPSRLDMRGVA